jgi:serine/threonine protein kinase/tetratricopeptide (TPR) repeat protein
VTVRAPSPPNIADLVGHTLAHFRVVERLGEGGMGVVYKAIDERLERVVALKVLTPSVAGDEQHRARFLREARAEAAVTHPNIATVYEVDEAGGRIFLALEFIEGETLRQKLAHGPLEMGAALEVGLAVVRALGKAHGAGIVHRDLKPDNVMVSYDGQVKVLDFGLAQLLDAAPPSTRPDLASSQHIVGTPAYMAPEQLTGARVDARTDLFAIGVLLYELLTGRRPFAGTTVLAVAASLERDTPEPPSTYRPAVPPPLDALVLRCLAKAPEDRFGSADELAAALEEVLPETTAVRQLSARTRAQLRAHRKERPAWVAPVVLTLGALGAGVVIALTPTGEGAKRPARPPVTTDTPVATPVTSLPLPNSASPEALAAYRAGVQALRDASWGVAMENFRRAAELDPTMTLANLRFAQTALDMPVPMTEVRESFRKALQGRAQLSPRDQALLSALEPVITEDPPDMTKQIERIHEAQKRYPMDAEFLVMGLMEPRLAPEDTLAIVDRILAIDDKSADGYQSRARALAFLGRGAEAEKAIEQCLTVSPASNDCLRERSAILVQQGECSRAEADLRRWAAVNPSSWEPYRHLAAIAATTGRPRELVEALLEQKWSRVAPAQQAVEKALDRARFAAFYGDFATAEAEALEARKLVAGDSDEYVQRKPALLLTLVYSETDRVDRAAVVADAFLKRRDAWLGGAHTHGIDHDDDTGRFLLVLRRAGLLDDKGVEAAIAARAERLRVTLPAVALDRAISLQRFALVETESEARAILPEVERVATATAIRDPKFLPLVDAGRVYLLAEQPAKALPFLEAATGACNGTETGDYFPAFLLLGQAREKLGQTAAACEAYRVVVHSWGRAKPKSITAQRARERALALGCSLTATNAARVGDKVTDGRERPH